MTDAARRAKAEYHRRWQQANKDKVREYQATYWERRAAALEEMPGKQDRPQR